MNTQVNLEKLVARYVDGTCGQTDLDELEALLLENAVNRKYLIEIVLLSEDLAMMGGSRQQMVNSGLLPLRNMLLRQRTRAVKTALLAQAAVILFSVVALWTRMAP